MVRRRKAGVLRQLPNRLDQNLPAPMTEMQILYHRENADSGENYPTRAKESFL
jgi:hypothetical protein